MKMILSAHKWSAIFAILSSTVGAFPSAIAYAGDAPRFSFAVVADPRGHGDTWKNALTEIRDMTVNPEPKFSPSEFIIVVGDMDPADDRHSDYTEVFSRCVRKPLFLPVIGNHDDDEEELSYISDTIVPAIPGVVRRHPSSCDYFLDYKNVRVIVVDAYHELGHKGVINRTGKEWAENVIVRAPPQIEHIFLFFHEPAFPRFRHLTSSFNESPKERNSFWNMLVRHRDRVCAVFVSHDHHYYRIKVKSAAGAAANDTSLFPDEEGGVCQVGCGAAGMDWVNTVIRVQVDGKNVIFRVVQAKNGMNKPFAVKDEWQVIPCPAFTPTHGIQVVR